MRLDPGYVCGVPVAFARPGHDVQPPLDTSNSAQRLVFSVQTTHILGDTLNSGRTLLLAAAGLMATTMVACAPASSTTEGSSVSPSESVAADSFAAGLKGSWSCVKQGEGTFGLIEDGGDSSGSGFSLSNNGTYELAVGEGQWEVADVPRKYGSYEETRSSGTYELEGNKLVFKIEKYEYADGTIEKPSHTLTRETLGKTFTVNALPSKFSERGFPEIRDTNSDEPLRYMPTSMGFSLQRSETTSLECIKGK